MKKGLSLILSYRMKADDLISGLSQIKIRLCIQAIEQPADIIIFRLTISWLFNCFNENNIFVLNLTFIG